MFVESLCGCCDDCGICCFGCVAPAFLFGENIEKIDGTNCVVAYCAYSLLCDTCTCCCYHFYKRGVLRHKYGLRKDQCNDCAVTFFCCQCAICQEARFLRKRSMSFSRIEIDLNFD